MPPIDILTIITVISASAAVASAGVAGFALRYSRRAEERAKAADARATEAHEMMREAHRMAKEEHAFSRARHVQEERERTKLEIASNLVEEAYQRAAADPSSALVGTPLKSDASELEREAALSLKRDPRVADVTTEANGTIRIWVDASGFPKMP